LLPRDPLRCLLGMVEEDEVGCKIT